MIRILILTFSFLRATYALGQNYDKAKAHLDQGIIKVYIKDYKGALQNFNKAVELDPNNAENYYIQGITRFYLKDYLGARNDMIKTLEVDPIYNDALIALDALNNIIKEVYGL